MESKVSATHRLQAEGRWEEASIFRDQARKELKKEGWKRADANEEAWRRMLEKFPPLTLTNAQGPQLQDDVTTDEVDFEFNTDAPVNLGRDVVWTYQHLVNRRVKPQDAPSGGAWGLLQWAKRRPDRFFEQLLPRALGPSSGRHTIYKKSDHDRVAEMRQMIAKIKADGEG